VTNEVHGVAVPNVGSGDALEEALERMREELDKHYLADDDWGDCIYVFNSNGKMRFRSSSAAKVQLDIIRKVASSINTNGTRSASPSLKDRKPSPIKMLKSAYREARSKNSGLLSDATFLSSFLEAENYNAQDAAKRLIKYLAYIRELYETSEVLFRPIFIKDLNPVAREQLAMGSYQILPDRDSSGRRVFVYLRDICPSVASPNERSQVWLYYAQRVAEDKEGMVVVMFLHNSRIFTGIEDDGEIFQNSQNLISCMPSRFRAIHLCFPNHPFFNAVKAAIILVIGREYRSRLRFHSGSHTECHYSLGTFGIPTNRLPIALELNTTHRKDNITQHTKWLRTQQAKETAIEKIYSNLKQDSTGRTTAFEVEGMECGIGNDADISDNKTTVESTRNSCAREDVWSKAVNLFRSKSVECPRHEDCLFGRGRNTMKHPGNVAMRRLLEDKRERYICASHRQKSNIAWEVVMEIKNGGGRFLREETNNGFYTLVDDETARKKISIAFRDLKNKQKRTHRLESVNNWETAPTVNYASASPTDGQCFTKRLKHSQE